MQILEVRTREYVKPAEQPADTAFAVMLLTRRGDEIVGAVTTDERFARGVFARLVDTAPHSATQRLQIVRWEGGAKMGVIAQWEPPK